MCHFKLSLLDVIITIVIQLPKVYSGLFPSFGGLVVLIAIVILSSSSICFTKHIPYTDN